MDGTSTAVLNRATPPERANRLSPNFCVLLSLEETVPAGVLSGSVDVFSVILISTKKSSFLRLGCCVTRYIGTSELVGGNWTCAFDVRHELLQRHFLLQQFQLSFEFPYLLGKCHSFLNFWLSYRKKGVQELT